MKRLLVVLLLYAFGQRTASPWNFIGLLVCTTGLLIYAWDKSRSHDNSIPCNEKMDEDTKIGHSRRSRNVFLCMTYMIIPLGCLGFATYTYSQHRTIASSSTWKETFNDVGIHRMKRSYQDRVTFDKRMMERTIDVDLLPNLDQFPKALSNDLSTFLNRSLNTHPTEANFLSEKLSTADEVITEAQRLHFNILGKELQKYKYAFLIDIAAFENKGDPCITAGEIYFLARMNIEILYYCSATRCSNQRLQKARDLAEKYSVDDLVILVHGGGNIIGYAYSDSIRFNVIKLFPTFRILVFPQSIWIKDWNHPHVKRTVENYCCNANLTIVLRDTLSYSIAKKLYNGTTRLIMAPDMAFQIGNVPRFMSPVFDIMWIKRKDGETPGYSLPESVPKHLRVHISDWWKWVTPAAGTQLEKAFYIATNGFFFIQRGRVIITDRLHGHILSVLMDIPHVLIDNKAKKLSSYHNSWTRSLTNTVITDDPSKALDLAIELLSRYNDTLPHIVPNLHLREDFSESMIGVPDASYP